VQPAANAAAWYVAPRCCVLSREPYTVLPRMFVSRLRVRSTWTDQKLSPAAQSIKSSSRCSQSHEYNWFFQLTDICRLRSCRQQRRASSPPTMLTEHCCCLAACRHTLDNHRLRSCHQLHRASLASVSVASHTHFKRVQHAILCRLRSCRQQRRASSPPTLLTWQTPSAATAQAAAAAAAAATAASLPHSALGRLL
jgi:hypothetical protein